MKILGINFEHDASLALLSDGKIIQFEELERTSRLKHQYGVTSQEIMRFLDNTGVALSEISLASLCSTQFWMLPHSDDISIRLGPISDVMRALLPAAVTFSPKAYQQGKGTGGSFYANQLALQGIKIGTAARLLNTYDYAYLQGAHFADAVIAEEFSKLSTFNQAQVQALQKEFFVPGTIRIGTQEMPCFYVEHHFCHANYAHYYSPDETSLISTHDGGLPALPFNSGGLYFTNAHGVVPFIDHRLALGYFYDQISISAGVGEAGKLMGLASYAEANQEVRALVEEMVALGKASFSREKINEMAAKISKTAKRTHTMKKNAAIWQWPDTISAEKIQAAADVQYLVENMFVDTIGAMAAAIAAQYPAYKTLNLTGGFTLNCPTNHLLQQKYIQLAINPLPGCGDTGNALGACVATHIVLAHAIAREGDAHMSAAFPPLNVQTGANPDEAVRHNLIQIEQPESLPAFIAEQILAKKILCIFRGRSEVGPRALGHRSIIAHATSVEIRDRINHSKGREMWCPLAPICRKADYHHWFAGNAHDARYMLFTNRVLQPEKLPGITHIDGSARTQSITPEDAWLYPALDEIERLGGVPVIINTSFNCAGEPIVETLQHAFKSFAKMHFDYLVTEQGMFTRRH